MNIQTNWEFPILSNSWYQNGNGQQS